MAMGGSNPYKDLDALLLRLVVPSTGKGSLKRSCTNGAWTLARRAALVCALYILSSLSCVAASDELDGHRDSVIYIESTFKNPESGEVLVESSSGFVASSQGFVIGSKHAVAKVGYVATFRGAVGSRDAALEKLELERVSSSEDVALLRFTNTLSARKPLSVATAVQPKVGDAVYFSGFYGSEEWVGVRGTINSVGGVNGTFLTDLKIGKGSSGGPVMTTDGQVIAIVWGGVADSDSGAIRIIPARKFSDLLTTAAAPQAPPQPTGCSPVQPGWVPANRPPEAIRYDSNLQLADEPNSLFDDNITSLSVRSSGADMVFELKAAQPTIAFLVIRFLIEQAPNVPLEKQYGFRSGTLARCVSIRNLGSFPWSVCDSVATKAQVVSEQGDKWKVTWTIPKSEVGLTGKAKVGLFFTEQMVMPTRTIIF